VQNFDGYRKRAERAQQAAENSRDPQAKRLWKKSAQRWWQLAEFVSRPTKIKSWNEKKKGHGEDGDGTDPPIPN
jgi:hypothetical protein